MLSRLLLILLAGTTLYSQTATTTPPADASKQAYVIEHFSMRASFEADGTGVKIWTSQVKVVSDAGVQKLAVLNFNYTSASENLEVIYVRVRKPDGTVVKTPDYNVQDMPADVTRSAPLYSDLHEKHVAVKALGVGDTLEYQIREQIVKPEIPNHFWLEYSFGAPAILKDELVEVSFPSTKSVKVLSPDYKPTIREENGRKIYSWQHSTVAPPTVDDDASDENEEKPPSIQISTFSSWEEIGRWYQSLQQEAVKPTPAIVAKAAELTKNLTTDEQKVRAIYNFVSLNIHYVGLDFGIGRYKPHAAQDVLENEYGDCKDKHTLLAALLQAAGFQAWPVLIHTSRKLEPDVPSPSQFNHVISAVPLKGKILWLDTTPEVAPFEVLSPVLRDKKALLIASNEPPRIASTPATNPFPQQQAIVVSGALSKDGVFNGHFALRFRGDVEIALRTAYRTVAEAQWNQLAQRISASMNYGGDVSNVKISSPTDTSGPFVVNYDYIRKDYGDWEDRRITLPLPPMGIEVAVYARKAPKKPYPLGALGEITYECKLDLPSGASIDRLPARNLVEEFAEYHTTYEDREGTISVVRRLIIKKTEVPVTDWDKFKDFAKQVNDDEFTFLPVRGIPDAHSAADLSKEENLEARVRTGERALEERDGYRAVDIFQQVIAVNPKYSGAHFDLANAFLLRGDFEQALTNLHAEQKITPTDERAYRVAFSIENFIGRKDAAMEDLRSLIKANPSSQDAPVKLADMLLEARKPEEAIEVLEPALKGTPSSLVVRLSLARAYARSGENAKAQSTLAELHDSDADPSSLHADLLTNLAIDLADSGVDRDRARRFAEVALKRAEDAPVEIESKNPQPAIDLSQAWDALGWTYFREGQTAKGEAYVRAAWTLSQRPTIGLHLAEIYEKSGQVKLAIHQYPLVMAAAELFSGLTFGATHRFGHERDIAEQRFEKLTGKKPELNSVDRLPNGKWTTSPSEELSRMRQSSLGANHGISGGAEMAIVLTAAGVETSQFVGGDPALKAKSDLLRSAHFSVEFPSGSKAKVALRAQLSCHDAEGCNVTLLPLQEVPTPFR